MPPSLSPKNKISDCFFIKKIIEEKQLKSQLNSLIL